MNITTFVTPGLGDSTYLFEHDGVGILVDPQRDIDRFVEAATGLDTRFVLETHLHNDYVSGGRSAAHATGAELVLPASSGAAFDHLPAFHLEDLDGGSFTVRPIHTPGHTPEHVSYLVLVDGEAVALFSGGSLLVGSAGRSDLLGMDRAESLAKLQYQSVTRLGALPDNVALYPTHGAGSFCTSSVAETASSTIGNEKRSNPVLAHPTAASFVAQALTGLQPYPDYYAHMGPINLAGPEPMPSGSAPLIAVDEIPGNAHVVDIRPQADYAARASPWLVWPRTRRSNGGVGRVADSVRRTDRARCQRRSGHRGGHGPTGTHRLRPCSRRCHRSRRTGRPGRVPVGIDCRSEERTPNGLPSDSRRPSTGRLGRDHRSRARSSDTSPTSVPNSRRALIQTGRSGSSAAAATDHRWPSATSKQAATNPSW